jgi:predicted transcriptional regulator
MLTGVVGSRRSSAEILLEILALCDIGSFGKTAIMYRCNLSYGQLSHYLSSLSTQDLIVKDHSGHYQLTSEGQSVFAQVTEAVRIIQEL